jgi:hypothetical protein
VPHLNRPRPLACLHRPSSFVRFRALLNVHGSIPTPHFGPTTFGHVQKELWLEYQDVRAMRKTDDSTADRVMNACSIAGARCRALLALALSSASFRACLSTRSTASYTPKRALFQYDAVMSVRRQVHVAVIAIPPSSLVLPQVIVLLT